MSELLAPAGSKEALTAAVRCGADAVYLGVGSFNARQSAENFMPDELADVVAYCHIRGVAVHMALNTLVRASEWEAALSLARTAGRAGVDALIVQDLGLARHIRAAMPTMPLHASTQLSCHTPMGVDILREAGFSRVVLSREMSQEEIAACIGRGCEIEVFVHGALCMSVSGQCYMSAMLGGRSGNRGRCAQPCRLPFSTENGRGKAALSLKDQSLIAHIPTLTQMGVDSLKIEGRMKRPEYVAAVVTACRAALDGQPPDEALLSDVQRVFSRSGFTDGYFTGNRGSAMFGVRRKEDVTAASSAFSRITPLYRHERQSVAVSMDLRVSADSPCTLTAEDANGHCVTVAGETAQAVRTQPFSAERATQQLQKSGGTPFAVTAVHITADEGVTLPLSAVSALRRDALEQLSVRRAVPTVQAWRDTSLPSVSVSAPYRGKRVVRLAAAEQYTDEVAVCADTVILPLTAEIPSTLPPDKAAVDIPRGMFGTEDAVRTRLMQAVARGVRWALCHNIGAVALAQSVGMRVLGGFGLNVTNPAALCALAEMGVSGVVGSFELTFPQYAALCGQKLPIGLFVYGRQPLMLTRNCPRRCAAGQCDGCAGGGLIDRRNIRFPVQCAGGCTELLNSVCLELADKQTDLPSVDFQYFHFTDETAAQVVQVLARYTRGDAAPTGGTRGLYIRGVE